MSDTTSRPGPQRFADPSRGTNQVGVRLYNERLVLSLVRRHGALPKADIARLTGLSPQTTTVIMNRLAEDGLLLRQPKQRGKVGQPAVPYAANPDGASALGLKIGRRSSDMVLVDFVGEVRARRRLLHPFPEPRALMDWVAESLAALSGPEAGPLAERIVGLGVALPFELWSWPAEAGAPAHAVDAWRAFDVRRELEAASRWPVTLCNDATSACAAELMAEGGRFRDFLYVFCGSFVGGGVVLDHALYPGHRGNAGAIGSMPVARAVPDQGMGRLQLIHAASVIQLERQLVAEGRDASAIWGGGHDADSGWAAFGPVLDRWIDQAALAIAEAAVSATAVIDFNAVIVDGVFPASVRARLVQAVARAAEGFDRRGLSPVEFVPGSVGPLARPVGAATLPLMARFARDRDVLFKDAAE